MDYGTALASARMCRQGAISSTKVFCIGKWRDSIKIDLLPILCANDSPRGLTTLDA